ncbi:MAG: hypothetical protein KJO11_16810 [Gemmatimonadetes bacterium]|nr:hypothetical protein [Gemmatimonadota bacterium]MBT8405213.1 hypothetical protein [Gemmatimonadota bacterium]
MTATSRSFRRAPVIVLLALLLPVAVSAQADPTALNEALRAAQRDHLWRVAVWGGASLAAGLAFAATAGDAHATRKGFGIQTAAWGAINLGIVAWGFAGDGGAVATDWASALQAEDRWAHLLLVNLGLNVGYVAVGSALWIASGRGLRSGDVVRGHAMAVVLQGAALLALDGWAWHSSSGRLSRLVDAVASVQVSAAPLPGSVAIGWSLPFPG